MRKTLFYLLIAITAVALLAACGAPQPAAEEPMAEEPAAEDTSEEAMASSSYESCLESQAAGNTFCEAPMLAARVEAGELPPVDERIWGEMIAIFRDNHFWISASDPLKNPLVVFAHQATPS